MASAALGMRSARIWRHTSRGIDAAVFDRYSTISTYFRRQSHPLAAPEAHGLRLATPRSGQSVNGLIYLRCNARIPAFHLPQHSRGLARRNLSSKDSEENLTNAPRPEPDEPPTADSLESTRLPSDNTQPKPPTDEPHNGVGQGDHNLENYSRFFRRLAKSLPTMHRPTRDDFLNVATNFWQRLRIRFKWFSIRSFRKFNADDMSAFFTWFIMSQTIWILVGTTTFFSAVFAVANSLRLQESLARLISDYLTSETGITIIFESAIVPKWKDSRISFKNVYVSRRPSTANETPKFDAGHAGHRSAARYDPGNHPAYHGIGEDEEETRTLTVEADENYTQFDLNVDSIDVTLSLWRWLDGKGLVEDAEIRGVRGVVDRRYVHEDPDHPLDLAAFRHKAMPGDFQLESLKLEDVLVTVHQPGSFRPYTASIFSADVKTFRKQWMFYDFLSAESVVGQFDNCLFSLHKPQSIGRTMEQDLKDGQWVRMSRIRIDGVNIDHLQSMTTDEGPLSWILSGKVDAVLDIKFPHSPDDKAIDDILGDIAEAISTVATAQAARLADRIPGQRELARPAIRAPSDLLEEQADTPLVVSIDIDLRFRDLKAAVPIFSKDLSYVNNALIRPIVAFINANRTLVPIHCKIIKNLGEFDGAWTIWETGLMDDIALKTYDALAYHVTRANFNRRVKTVSLWSLQKTAGMALSALQSVMDPYLQAFRAGDNPFSNQDVSVLAF
ncbi:hypothetical protein BD410DRAFT_784107 [Rickenella mellea]|uniref:Mitochondrial distribution and morphology protein family 31/32 n=1 Tax=Rickenella mellea TaxID=50990 RepID=A0A4Y7QEH7_9AGAM|nr:hypothetical protein BD410DRAFT_784107 [Rickenella mellea]